MWKVLARAWESFDRDQAGNVAILFAFSAIPLIAMLGGAVDVTRHQRHKTQILNAMDSAAIALARRGASDDADASAFVTSYIEGMLPPGHGGDMLHVGAFQAAAIDGGYRITASGSMDTAFLPVIGIDQMALDLRTEVAMSTQNYEVALVLDNTGSMASHGRIGALRDAAGQLVEDLYAETDADRRVKMALVPFVTTVNVRSATPGVFDMSWIDPMGSQENFASADGQPVDRLQLFEQMGVAWKGCVEARAEADEEDTAPATAATRWAPYLWPDEPDHGGYRNDYLDDSGSGGDWSRLRDVAKYAASGVPDRTNKGPNAACPRPLVELTNDRARMQQEIRLMKPHNESGGNSSGTNVAQGLLWGWRVLSPDAPFDQGAPYEDEETQKVLVLLSDGRNQVVPQNRVTGSDYTGYGYLAEGRMGSETDYRAAEREVDAKVQRVCAQVKDTGIRVYTILFQVDFERTQEIFRDCASTDDSGKPLYFYVPAASELQSAFDAIGRDMTSLHISR